MKELRLIEVSKGLVGDSSELRHRKILLESVSGREAEERKRSGNEINEKKNLVSSFLKANSSKKIMKSAPTFLKATSIPLSPRKLIKTHNMPFYILKSP